MADNAPVCSTGPCECCKQARCSKILRIPIEAPGGQVKIARVCGRCVVVNTRKLHEWIQAQQIVMQRGPVPK